MPFPIDAETIEAYEEGRSVLGSLVTQLIAIVRQIMNYVMRVSTMFIAWAGEHPLAMTLAVCNVMIWVS